MGYKVSDMTDTMRKGIAIINDRSLSPTIRGQMLKDLGYQSPADFAAKLTSRIDALRLATSK